MLAFVWDTISESLSDALLKRQTPFQALWSLRSVDLKIIALHPSFGEIAHSQERFARPIDQRANVILACARTHRPKEDRLM